MCEISVNFMFTLNVKRAQYNIQSKLTEIRLHTLVRRRPIIKSLIVTIGICIAITV